MREQTSENASESLCECDGPMPCPKCRAVVAHYMRYHTPYTEEFDTVDEAFRFLAYGEDSGDLASDKVVDGETVYERDTPEFWERLNAAWDALV